MPSSCLACMCYACVGGVECCLRSAAQVRAGSYSCLFKISIRLPMSSKTSINILLAEPEFDGV